MALLGWVGGLITAVSWQVIPMFYLAVPLSSAMKRTTQGLLVAGVLQRPQQIDDPPPGS